MLQSQDSLDLRTPRYGTYSKAYPQVPRSKPCVSPVTWLLLLASLVLAAAAGGRILQARRSSRQPPVLYAVVIDSGSSGTRIYAYNWTQPPSQPRSSKSSSSGGAGLPVIMPIPPSAASHLVPQHAQQGMYSRVETRPGLDTFAVNTSGLSTSLDPLLAWARGVVPPALQTSTPLFLMGTGGIRRLPGQQQAALLAAVRQLLAQSGFRFEANWARMISGDDEGALAWLALNYQQGRLGPYSSTQAAAAAAAAAAGTSGVHGSSTSSLGVLDLGGSSLQVTFQVPTMQTNTAGSPAGMKDSTSSSSHSKSSGGSNSQSSSQAAIGPAASSISPQYNLSVAGHTFQLHLHSFKQYGLNEAYDRSITLLLGQQQEQQRQEPSVQQQQQLGQHSEQSSTTPSSKAQAATTDAQNTAGSVPTASVPLPSAAAAEGAAIQHDIAVAGAAGIIVDLPSAAPSAASSSTVEAGSREQQVQAHSAASTEAAGHSSHAPPGRKPTPAGHTSVSPDGHTSVTPGGHTMLTPGRGPDSSTGSVIPAHSRAPGETLPLAGSSSHAGLQADSSSAGNIALHSSSSGGSSSSHGGLQAASNPADHSALHSSSSGGNRHRGLQSSPHTAAAQQQQQSQTAHQPQDDPNTNNGGHWGAQSTVLHIQGLHPHGLVPAAVGVSAAVRRRGSGVLRRSLLQQQLAWLEQLLGPAQHAQGYVGALHGREHIPTTSSTSSTGSTGHSSSSENCSSSEGTSNGLQKAAMLQHSHDVRLRQLLREYLLREDTGVAGAPLLPTRGANSTTASAVNLGSSSSSSLRAGLPVPVTAGSGNSDSEKDGAPAVVPIDGGGSSSSSLVPTAVALQAPGAATDSSSSPGSSSNSSSELSVVYHPCLHEGYEAVYNRVAYGGITPNPAQVLLRGTPDWPACLGLVTQVVNASAPCGVQEHAPACVLGTPQPKLQGNFMALTGFYVVSKFLGVQGSSSSSSSLEPLLGAAKTLCARPWPWVQQHLGQHVNVERYCTWGPYVATLLLRGLGLGEQRVVIAQDGDLGWPLGAVLVEASKLPGFSAGGAEQGSGVQQRRQQQKRQKRPGRHRKRARGSSMRGTGVLHQEQQAAAAATPAGGLSPSHSSNSQQQQQPMPHLQHEQQAAAHGAAAGATPGGPAWSLGLLHHNESSPGLHLSGIGWGAVLGFAWVVLVWWARGVCGPPKAPAGSVGAFLQLTGPLGGGGSAGHGRGHGVLGHSRSKISPNRSSFRSLKI